MAETVHPSAYLVLLGGRVVAVRAHGGVPPPLAPGWLRVYTGDGYVVDEQFPPPAPAPFLNADLVPYQLGFTS